MNTIAQIFPRTSRISWPEVTDGAKPDVPSTDVENEKKKTRNFQKFLSDDRKESLQYNPSLPPSLDSTSTRIRDENRDFRKSGKPPMKTGRGMPPMM